MSFDSTYEGLKRRYRERFPNATLSFDSTYEGLKPTARRAASSSRCSFRQYL